MSKYGEPACCEGHQPGSGLLEALLETGAGVRLCGDCRDAFNAVLSRIHPGVHVTSTQPTVFGIDWKCEHVEGGKND